MNIRSLAITLEERTRLRRDLKIFQGESYHYPDDDDDCFAVFISCEGLSEIVKSPNIA